MENDYPGADSRSAYLASGFTQRDSKPHFIGRTAVAAQLAESPARRQNFITIFNELKKKRQNFFCRFQILLGIGVILLLIFTALLFIWIKEAQGCVLDKCALIAPRSPVIAYYSKTAAEEAESALKAQESAAKLTLAERITAGDTSITTLADFIRYQAKNEGIDENLLYAIAKAESGLILNATTSLSSASGLFQFIDDTYRKWCVEKYEIATSTEDKNNPLLQTDCAIKMIKNGEINHWDSSRKMWQKWYSKSLT